MHGFGNHLGMSHSLNYGSGAKHYVTAGKYAGASGVSVFVSYKQTA